MAKGWQKKWQRNGKEMAKEWQKNAEMLWFLLQEPHGFIYYIL